jgi:preprotein translocase subunit YajC
MVTREVTLQNIASSMLVPSVLLVLLKYVIIDPQQKKRKKR